MGSIGERLTSNHSQNAKCSFQFGKSLLRTALIFALICCCVQHSKGVRNGLLDSVMRFGVLIGVTNTTYRPKFLACKIYDSRYHMVTKMELGNTPV